MSIRGEYDTQVRQQRQGDDPAYLWEWDDNVFRLVGPGAELESAVLFARCDAANVDATIARQVDYFGAQGKSFEWKRHDYDAPPDLADRLRDAGFTPQDEETLMVFDLARTFAADCDGSLEEIEDPDRFVEFVPLHEAVYGDADLGERLAHTFASEKRANPAGLRMFFVRAEGVLVSAGWMRLPRGCAFASLWGGKTHPDWRKRGCYSALVAARLDAARDAGFQYVTVDAGPESRSLLERRGFEKLALITPWIRRP